MKPSCYLGLRVVSFATLLLWLTSSTATAAQTAAPHGIKSIALGIIAQKSQKQIEEHFLPFITYVAKKLGAGRDVEASVVIVPTPLQMAILLGERRIDFYMESPYPTYVVNKQGAAGLLLRRWKSGMAEYRSLIFARKNSATRRLEQLRGAMMAFEDSGSTSGYFLPKVLLLKKGFNLTEKPRPDAPVRRDEIGYVFAFTHGEVLNWVLSNRVVAGAFSSDDFGALDQERRSNIAVLAQTDLFPRHLVSVRKDFNPTAKKHLKEILLSMHRDKEGQKIMQQIDNTTRFDVLPGGEEMVRRKMLETFRPSQNK